MDEVTGTISAEEITSDKERDVNMTDREKVISGLEISIISDTDAGFSTIEIPVQQAENILCPAERAGSSESKRLC